MPGVWWKRMRTADAMFLSRNEERSFLDKFAKFINNKNIYELMEEFNTAHYQIGRNANAKILFTDLTIKLTKLVKKGV